MITTLIVGRTASGKTIISKKLKTVGFQLVKSYTTRKKRNEEDNDHIFITKEEAKRFKNKAAKTVINDNEYFATDEQIKESDYYVIDPTGIKYLVKNMPNTNFRILYIKADKEKRKEKYMSRGETEKHFNSRDESETKQFDEFEEKLKTPQKLPKNIVSVTIIENDYTDNLLYNIVASEASIEAFSFSNLAILVHMDQIGALPPNVDVETYANTIPLDSNAQIEFLSNLAYGKNLEDAIESENNNKNTLLN